MRNERTLDILGDWGFVPLDKLRQLNYWDENSLIGFIDSRLNNFL